MLANEITSLQHAIVKKFVKLRSCRKFRQEQKQVVLVGIHEVEEAKELDCILVKKNFSFPFKAKTIFFVTEEILKKVSGMQNPEPIVATTPLPSSSSLIDKHWILALDNISDPGNLGTLLRSALALGWQGVFLIQCVDLFNEKVLRSAKGASFRLPFYLGTKQELIALAAKENFCTFVADTKGVDLKAVSAKNKTLLILGNESLGVDIELKNQFSAISIPMENMESLNVAAAGAILLYTLKNEK